MAGSPHLLVPLLTPLDGSGAIDAGLLRELARRVLGDGAAGIVLFGTLGEAQSFSVAERMAALEALLGEGIPADTIMVGTGAAALPDVVELGRHALSAGCTRQLLLPPFFFKGVTDEGVLAFFSAAVDAVADPRLRLTLYDIPSVVSVEIAPAVVETLLNRHGEVIAGIKDSVADWSHVSHSITAFPSLDVYVGNEIFVPEAIAIGGAGAISGLGNLAAGPMADVAAGRAGRGHPTFAAVERLYRTVTRHPVIPAVRALAARRHGIAALGRPRPPLVPFDLSADPSLAAALDDLVAATAA